MCIFFTASGELVAGYAPRVSVANTRIFARLTGAASQLLVYEMSFGSQADAAMVLPLPVADARRADAVRFIDFSQCTRFFRRLDMLAPLDLDLGGIEGLSMVNLPDPDARERPPIPVREVGAYEASYVPSVADFDRLDKRFAMPAGLWDAHPQYADYGFAVFRLRPTEGALKGVHPMAFEFDSRLRRRLFAPTVHVHDGAVHAMAYFDHRIYVQGATIREEIFTLYRDGVPANPGERVSGPHYTGTVRFSSPSPDVGPGHAAEFGTPAGPGTRPPPFYVAECTPYLDPCENLHAVEMKGMLPNTDTFFSVSPVQTRPAAAHG